MGDGLVGKTSVIPCYKCMTFFISRISIAVLPMIFIATLQLKYTK